MGKFLANLVIFFSAFHKNLFCVKFHSFCCANHMTRPMDSGDFSHGIKKSNLYCFVYRVLMWQLLVDIPEGLKSEGLQREACYAIR